MLEDMLMKATFLATLVAAMPLLTAALLLPAAANWRPWWASAALPCHL